MASQNSQHEYHLVPKGERAYPPDHAPSNLDRFLSDLRTPVLSIDDDGSHWSVKTMAPR